MFSSLTIFDAEYEPLPVIDAPAEAGPVPPSPAPDDLAAPGLPGSVVLICLGMFLAAVVVVALLLGS